MAVGGEPWLKYGLLLTAISYFSHWNIVRYCHRPFAKVEDMNDVLMRRWNEKVKPEDTVFHLGDFAFKNSAGGKAGEGLPIKSNIYEQQLNGKIVFILGNHDRNNSTNAVIDCAMIHHGGMDIFATHVPPDNLFAVPDSTDLILCGHVHDAWKHRWLSFPKERAPILEVNVGCDVWDFRPIDIQDIHQYIASIKEGRKP